MLDDRQADHEAVVGSGDDRLARGSEDGTVEPPGPDERAERASERGATARPAELLEVGDGQLAETGVVVGAGGASPLGADCHRAYWPFSPSSWPIRVRTVLRARCATS